MKLTLGVVVEVERIIDSDTLLCWFRVLPELKLRHRLRLKGIEGGELGTIEGERGTLMMERAFKEWLFGPFTFHGNMDATDQHGRIVGDLKDARGQILTLTLLANGAHWRRTRSGVETKRI